MPAELPLDIHALIRRALHRQVRLPEFSQPVYIEDAQTIDDLDLLSLAVRTRDGQTAQTIVSAADLAPALDQSATQLSITQSLANPLDFFLLVEAARIRLAYSFDPFFAVSMSGVQALPHQLQAVYERMLPQARLRFLLADDPGAGKTIMAGLLLKELKLRGVITYVLILTPAPLTIQWQDELYRRFQLPFDILTNDKLEAARTGNWFLENPLVIARLDKLSRNEDVQQKLQAPDCRWDLVVCDEAHKLSATFFGGEIKYTKRHKLGQLLSTLTRHFLLMTATPHNGKEADFQLFMSLLDGDRFEGRFRDGVHQVDTSDLMRRLTKEQLRRICLNLVGQLPRVGHRGTQIGEDRPQVVVLGGE